MSPQRTRVDVVPHLGGIWWLVVQPNHRAIRCLRRQDAIDVARLACRYIESLRGKAQMVVRTRRGTIAFERTFPDDTPGAKG